MSEYLVTSFIAPCMLISAYCCKDKYKRFEKKREAIATGIFRFHSSISFSLINTYRLLGHMAPIPESMEDWSKKLYDLLTTGFYKQEYFKKCAFNKFTCTNIPVLVAILVFLESKKVFSFETSVSEMNKKHHSKGSLSWTHRWIKNNFEASEDDMQWNTLLPFFMDTPHHRRKNFQLHEGICLLLTGGKRSNINGTNNEYPAAPGGVERFRNAVNSAIQDLSYTTIINLLKESKFSSPTLVVRRVRDINPYLPNPEIKALLGQPTKIFQVAELEATKLDLLAKAFNVQVCIEMLNSCDSDQETEQDKKPSAVGKGQAVDLGQFKFLSKPIIKKKGKRQYSEVDESSVVPEAIKDYAREASVLLKTKLDKTKIDFQAEPDFVWGKLQTLGEEEVSEDSEEEDAESATTPPMVPIPKKGRAVSTPASLLHPPMEGTKTTPATGPVVPGEGTSEMKTSMPDTPPAAVVKPLVVPPEESSETQEQKEEGVSPTSAADASEKNDTPSAVGETTLVDPSEEKSDTADQKMETAPPTPAAAAVLQTPEVNAAEKEARRIVPETPPHAATEASEVQSPVDEAGERKETATERRKRLGIERKNSKAADKKRKEAKASEDTQKNIDQIQKGLMESKR
jgi:hypothetical protein